jgi:HAD superfamily hydrolase (TIGR01490 family)
MIKASYWLAKYHIGFTNLDDVITQGLSLMQGHHEADVLKEAKDFFKRDIQSLYRKDALEALKRHRESGHTLALLTSCFDGLAELVSMDLGFDHCLCTRLEVDRQGLYTGRAQGHPCFGRHKIAFAQGLCNTLNIELQSCFFYTDSASDLPLLNLVGRPIAVNPDLHLRAWARLKKWDIVDWRSKA